MLSIALAKDLEPFFCHLRTAIGVLHQIPTQLWQLVDRAAHNRIADVIINIRPVCDFRDNRFVIGEQIRHTGDFKYLGHIKKMHIEHHFCTGNVIISLFILQPRQLLRGGHHQALLTQCIQHRSAARVNHAIKQHINVLVVRLRDNRHFGHVHILLGPNLYKSNQFHIDT